MAGGREVALSKFPEPGIRPICVTDCFRRLVIKGLLRHCQDEIDNFFQNSHPRAFQFGGGNPRGATNMFHLLAGLSEGMKNENISDVYREDPMVICTTDIENAFNRLDRKAMLDFFAKGCDQHVHTLRANTNEGGSSRQIRGWDILWPYMQAFYGTQGELRVYQGGETSIIQSQTGFQQGCGLGSSGYALTTFPPILRTVNSVDGVLIGAFADNIAIAGRWSQVQKAVDKLHSEFHQMGLRFNERECLVYIPNCAQSEGSFRRHLENTKFIRLKRGSRREKRGTV